VADLLPYLSAPHPILGLEILFGFKSKST
jgi:hypothetical protein